MRCVVFGATGYFGLRLVPELLASGHEVRVMARTPAKLDSVPWRDDVDVVEGDVTDADKVRRALDSQQTLYYLVHSMLAADFVNVDARGASIVADAAAAAGLTRIVYMGGIIAQHQLRADVPLPGRLWLELSASDEGAGHSRFRQRVVFQPYGLAGEVFWGASTPFRDALFAGIARDITASAGATYVPARR